MSVFGVFLIRFFRIRTDTEIYSLTLIFPAYKVSVFGVFSVFSRIQAECGDLRRHMDANG